MKKTIVVIVASLGLALGAMPAFAGTQDPIHLTVQDLHCYEVGLVIGSADQPCQEPVTCVPGDTTCAWFCDIDNPAFTVECSTAAEDRGLLNWLNILYRTIDHYRATSAQWSDVANRQAAQIEHQSEVIRRKRARIEHLRKALAKARHHR